MPESFLVVITLCLWEVFFGPAGLRQVITNSEVFRIMAANPSAIMTQSIVTTDSPGNTFYQVRYARLSHFLHNALFVKKKTVVLT